MDIEAEKEQIVKAQSNIKEFAPLFDEYYPQILKYLIGRIRSVEIAQDIASVTFLKALENIKKFNCRGISISSWLYRIATNEVTTYFRKNKTLSLDEIRACENFDPPAIGNPYIEIVQAQEKIENDKKFLNLQNEILKLHINYQEVIMLRYFEKKQINEIAEILNKSEGTIKSLLHRGLKKLKKNFQLHNSDARTQPFQNKNVLNIEQVLVPIKL
ncbi:RNA polymerase sigma factor [Patescibacteria group bacterium]|nr:MAG: RNA polymerase sigma factor [Patescibacteria group bacterium]